MHFHQFSLGTYNITIDQLGALFPMATPPLLNAPNSLPKLLPTPNTSEFHTPIGQPTASSAIISTTPLRATASSPNLLGIQFSVLGRSSP